MPAEWVTAPGADPARVVLYLHGGAYVVGSVNTHRDLAGRYHEWVRWVVGIVESERDRYRVATGVDQVPGFATERPRFTGGVRL